MAAKEKERNSSFKLTDILNFFEELISSSKSTRPTNKVSSVDEACNESVNREPVVQKEELIHWPPVDDESTSKGNDDSKASSKGLQDKDNKDLTRPVEIGVECIIETVKTENRSRKDRSKSVERSRNELHSVQSDSPRECGFKTEEERQSERNLIQNRSRQDRSKSVGRPRNEQHSVQSDSPRECGFITDEERQSERNLIQNRSRQNRSKSVERPRNEQHSVQENSPRWCKFKTEDGRWLCQVCSWISSDRTIMSFLDHCSSTNHREKMKGRFEQEIGGFHPYKDPLSEVKKKTGESKADTQFLLWPEQKKNGDNLIVRTKKQQGNIEQQKKSEIYNSKKPTTEMICKSQQTQNRVCQESSKLEGLCSRMKDLLREELSPLPVTHALPENKTRNDKRVNEMKPKASSFKEKLFEVVKEEEKAEIRKGEKKKAKNKTDEKTNLNTNKVEADSKVNTSNTKNLRKGGGGGGEGSSQIENLRMDELRKWISALGITFIEPVSVSVLSCKLCEKQLPAGSSLETLVINVGIHIEGKPHIKKLEVILEASNTIVNLMKRIQKCPAGSLPNF